MNVWFPWSCRRLFLHSGCNFMLKCKLYILVWRKGGSWTIFFLRSVYRCVAVIILQTLYIHFYQQMANKEDIPYTKYDWTGHKAEFQEENHAHKAECGLDTHNKSIRESLSTHSPCSKVRNLERWENGRWLTDRSRVWWYSTSQGCEIYKTKGPFFPH